MSFFKSARLRVLLCWIGTIGGIGLWAANDDPGWDVTIYHQAIVSVQRGRDPYLDATARQEAYHQALSTDPSTPLPFGYIYPPITLPLLRAIGATPAKLAASLYYSLYALGVLSMIWCGLRLVEPRERLLLLPLAPLLLFLPGLVYNDTVLSGNIAIPLYGAVLASAYKGWRDGIWQWCYLSIFVAGIFKPPLLTLLAIPLLSARRQLFPSFLTAWASLALMAVQFLLWPSLSANFLHALNLQLTYNRDFGCSLAGLVSKALLGLGRPYSAADLVVYLASAAAVFGVLVVLSRRFLAGQISLEAWGPVLLIGTVLLNPRIMQYDMLPLSVPMALIAWRGLRRLPSLTRQILIPATLLAATSYVAAGSLNLWRLTEGPVLILIFGLGSGLLVQQTRRRVAVRKRAAVLSHGLYNGWTHPVPGSARGLFDAAAPPLGVEWRQSPFQPAPRKAPWPPKSSSPQRSSTSAKSNAAASVPPDQAMSPSGS